MSQYGALGFAQNGSSYDQILGHYYTDTELGTTDPNETVRVLLQSSWTISFSGASRAGTRRINPAQSYQARRRGSSSVDLLTSSGRRIASLHRAAQRLPARRRRAARRQRHVPRRARAAARHVQRHERDQRRAARRLRARRDLARVARLVADRGAEGAGGRRAHVRDHQQQGRRRLRPLQRHALAGLRRRRRRDRVDRPGRRRDARPGRHLRRRAGHHVLLLDLRRPHRGRREHEPRGRAAAVAQERRRPVRRRVAQAPLGPDPAVPLDRAGEALRARQGPLQGHPRAPPRRVAADRQRRRDRQPRPHARRRRDAAGAARARRHLGLLHLDRHARPPRGRHRLRRRPAPGRHGLRHGRARRAAAPRCRSRSARTAAGRP